MEGDHYKPCRPHPLLLPPPTRTPLACIAHQTSYTIILAVSTARHRQPLRHRQLHTQVGCTAHHSSPITTRALLSAQHRPHIICLHPIDIRVTLTHIPTLNIVHRLVNTTTTGSSIAQTTKEARSAAVSEALSHF